MRVKNAFRQPSFEGSAGRITLRLVLGHAKPPLLALVAGMAAGVALVVALTPFVTVDGPIHVGYAATLRDLLQGRGDLAGTYLDWASWTAPNTLPELGLTLLMLVFSPGIAETVLIVLYVLALPLAMLYAVRAWSDKADGLALAALPLTFSYPLLLGFYSFSYSVVMFLVVAGYAGRVLPRLSWPRAGVLGALLVVTYLTHFIGFAAAALLVVVMVVMHARRTLLLRAGVALAPAAILAIQFLHSTSSAEAAKRDDAPPEVLAGTLSLVWGLVSFERSEIVATCLLALTLAIAIVTVARTRTRRLTPSDAPMLFALLVVAGAVAAPSEVASGGGVLTQRLALFPVYGVVLWLAAQRPSRAVVTAVGVASIVAAVGLAALRLPAHRALAADVRDIEQVVPCIGLAATMAQVNLAQVVAGSADRARFLTHETGRVSAATRGLDLGSPSWEVPFYLLRFDPRFAAAGSLIPARATMLAVPPRIDPARYERATRGRLDYVLLFGRPLATPAVLQSQRWRTFEGELMRRYRRVAVSPRGLMEVWEHPGVAARGASRRAAAPGGACVG